MRRPFPVTYYVALRIEKFSRCMLERHCMEAVLPVPVLHDRSRTEGILHG